MKRMARTLRAQRMLLLNWLRPKGAVSAATVAGFNNTANLTLRKPCGSRTHRITKIALNHAFGGPPEIRFTDRFCLGGSNRDLPEI